MIIFRNPKKTTIDKLGGTYEFITVTIPEGTKRIVTRYYKGKRKLSTIFAIELFSITTHGIVGYNLRLFIPDNATSLEIGFFYRNDILISSTKFNR